MVQISPVYIALCTHLRLAWNNLSWLDETNAWLRYYNPDISEIKLSALINDVWEGPLKYEETKQRKLLLLKKYISRLRAEAHAIRENS